MTIEFFSGTSDKKKSHVNNDPSAQPLIDTITNGFLTIDNKWTVRDWNSAAEKLLKVPAKDIIGKNLWEVFADTIPIDFYTVYQKAFLQDVPLHFKEYWGEMNAWFDVIVYNCDGNLSISFKSSNQPALNESNNTPAQQLVILNELYRLVTEVTNDCLWEWELNDKKLFWIDGGHKRVFGYHIENALIPQSFWESCLHPDDKERVLNGINKIITDGTSGTWEDEYRFKKADGSYANVHDRGYIFHDSTKKATRMIGATQDITARILLEIRLVESARKLSQVAKEIYKRQASKVQVPLSNIDLAVQMMASATTDDEKTLYLDIIARNSARISGLLVNIE